MKLKTITLALMSIFLFSCSEKNNSNKDTTMQEKTEPIMKQAHSNPKQLFDPTPFGFCHSVKAPSNGEYVFISGQSGGQDLEHTLTNDFRTQLQYTLKNIKIILDEHNLQPESIVKITILIVDHNNEKLKIWSEEMTKLWTNKIYPASTLIPVPRLALDGMQVEIDAIAFKKKE